MADFLSQSPGGDLHTHQLLHDAGGGGLSLVEMIVEGFLGLKASSPLRTIDFSDIVAPGKLKNTGRRPSFCYIDKESLRQILSVLIET